jgi:ABC-2 type transport system permease protein
MKAFLVHLSYDFRATLRDKSMLLMTYLFPLFFFVMMGLLMTKANPTFNQILIPSMILVAVMSGMLLGMPTPLQNAADHGIFRSYKINGVPSLSILIIPVISSILHMAIISAIILIAGHVFFDAVLPVRWDLFILVWAIALLTYAGLGVLIGVASPNSRATILISQLIFVPSMILGGLTMPASMLPDSLAKIALILPTSHAMSAFQSLAYGQTSTVNGGLELVLLMASGLLALGLAVYLFQWDKNLKRPHSAWLALLAITPFAVALFI